MLRHATGFYLANAGQDTRAIHLMDYAVEEVCDPLAMSKLKRVSALFACPDLSYRQG
jgi:hypothetical protein